MKNLFVIGAQRSGSTYLYKLLDDHCQISMAQPLRPEPKFFMNPKLAALGNTYYRQTYFNIRKPEVIYLGEKSTSYIEHPEAGRRIHNAYPDARIIAILRHPVLRAYSNYKFSVTNKLENLTFAEAIDSEDSRVNDASFTTSVSPFLYRRRGDYESYLRSYFDIFPKEQIKILIFEELVGNLRAVRDLYDWLGVRTDVTPFSLTRSFNEELGVAENHYETFRRLATDFKEPIARLETLLGRRIDSWRMDIFRDHSVMDRLR